MTLTASFDGPTHATQTWRAPGLALLAKVDLSGLVESGLVTGLRVLPDGSLVMDCPDGLPADLAGQVEPVLDAAEDRIARLEQGLARLTADLQAQERLTDRIDAVEFGLIDRLQGVIAHEVLNLFAEQEVAGSLAPEPATQGALLARLDAVCARPEVDLQPLTQKVDAVAERLDAAMQLLPPTAEGVAWLGTRVEGLASEVAQGTAGLAQLVLAVEGLGARIAALEALPPPKPDLTEQRKGFAHFATALGGILRRVETLGERVETLSRLEAKLDAALGGQRHGGRDALAEAMLTLARRMTEPGEPAAGPGESPTLAA